YPEGLYDLLMRLKRDYTLPPIIITENGAAVADTVEADGHVHDPRRISYLRDHLAALRRAMSEGVKVEGYCVWALLDNFEWAQGYTKRFIIVYVDFATRARIKKDSANWYTQVIRQKGRGAATPNEAKKSAEEGSPPAPQRKNTKPRHNRGGASYVLRIGAY